MPNYNPYPQYQPYNPYAGPYYQPIMPGYSGQPMAQAAPVQPQPVQAAPSIQNGGVINVRSEDEARNWPLAPNNSMTFVDEVNGYLYTKTSFNQFDRPQFVKYKLVRENAVESPVSGSASPETPSTTYAEKADMEALVGVVSTLNGTVGAMQKDIDTLKGDMYGLAGQKKSNPAKKETVKKEETEDA